MLLRAFLCGWGFVKVELRVALDGVEPIARQPLRDKKVGFIRKGSMNQ